VKLFFWLGFGFWFGLIAACISRGLPLGLWVAGEPVFWSGVLFFMLFCFDLMEERGVLK